MSRYVVTARFEVEGEDREEAMNKVSVLFNIGFDTLVADKNVRVQMDKKRRQPDGEAEKD